MVSLTTVYLVSIVLTSIAGFGSVFASKKFVGGAEVQPTLDNIQSPEVQPAIAEPEITETPPLPSTEQIEPVQSPLAPQ